MKNLTDKQKATKLRRALNAVLSHAISNRGTKHKFVTCYTYDVGDFPAVYKRAEKVLEATR